MKKHLLLFLICTIIICPSVLAGNKYRYKQKDALPPKVEVFISKHFRNYQLLKAKVDEKDNECKIVLQRGYELKLDLNGNWIEMECDYQPFPKTIIDLLPKPIITYIARNYPQRPIVKIKRKPYGYKVELIDDPELVFDNSGRLIKID